MAINFLNTVDLNFNQLNKAAIQNLSGDPVAGVLGQIYYDTAVSALKICTTAQVVGVSNAVWTEVGATSGVETISIGNANVNAGGVNTGLVRTPGTGIGDVVITPAIYGGGANVGMVPTGGSANKYLDGTGAWIDVTTGDIESVNAATAANLLGINITTPLGPNPTVGLDIVGRDVLGGTPATGDQLLIYDLDTTKNKKVTVGNLVGGFETTYDLTTAPTGTAVRLTGSDSTNDDVTISGTSGQTAMSRISASELRIALTDNVTIIGDATIGGDIDLTGQIDMNGSKIVSLGNGTLSSDAVNLGQVEALVAGIGLFKGGYNATTGLTVNLGAGNGSLDGTANIALDQGDFFVVTVAGGAFYTETLEVGDMIYANQAITANSNPGKGVYTVVIQDANIAGAGATDGATAKGVAGFDSENFSVSASGWVQLKRQANPYGISVPLTGGTNSGGQTRFTVDITTAARFGTGALAANCKAEVVTASGRQTVYPDITGNGTGSMDFKFIPTVADSVYTALITIV